MSTLSAFVTFTGKKTKNWLLSLAMNWHSDNVGVIRWGTGVNNALAYKNGNCLLN